ncbi:MAG TPA: cobalt transporter [Planctomycetaceae bacterium]|nr:cobalt transporter [Planctomycetaceae bacterium]
MHAHAHEITLGLAFFLGAVHALEPGHGKTAMLVYLSGRRGFWHPMVMGLSSGIAHSVSLIGIAIVVHLTQHAVTGDHHHEDATAVSAMQWLSGLLVLVVGGWMLLAAIRAKPTKCGCKHHQHAKDCGSAAARSSVQKKRSYSMSALLGVAFGLLPCPSALAAYFTSMSTGAPVAAYTVIALFAAGIACSLTLVGLLVQRFGDRFANHKSRLAQLPWPYIRAMLILAVGVLYTYRAAVA